MRTEAGSLLVKILCGAFLASASCTDQGTQPAIETTVASLFAINDNQRVTLGWTAWQGGTPSEIEVYRSNSAGFTPSGDTYYATVSGDASQFEDRSVSNGTMYYYRLVPVEVLDTGLRVRGTPSNVAIGRPFDYTTVTAIRYSSDIQTIFNSSCAVHACHVGPDDATPDGLSPLQKTTHGEQFSLLSWEGLFLGGSDGALAVAYKASKSPLIFHINSDTLTAPVAFPHMPRPGFALPAAQVETLIRWIDEGAQDDAGHLPYAVTPLGKMLGVCASEDLVAVIDVATNLVVRYVNVGRAADPSALFGSPHHVKVDAAGEYFYVTLINSQQVWKFSLVDLRFVTSVDVPFQPADLALTQSGDTAYVTSFASTQGLVTLLDTRSMRIIRSIYVPFASNPHGIVLSHDGTTVFATNAGSGNLTSINVSDNSTSLIALDTLGNPFQSDVSPYLVDISPDDRYLLVTDYASGGENVYVIDLLLDPSKPSRVIPIGGRSLHAAFTPDGTSAFVCNIEDNSVHVISMADFSVRTISNVGRQPHGVSFTPDGLRAFVTTENTFAAEPPHHPTYGSVGSSFVYVIEVPTLRVIDQIEVGAFGQGIAYAPR